MNTSKLLAVVIGLQTLSLACQFLGQPAIVAPAQAQMPDSGAQRAVMIEELKGMRADLKALNASAAAMSNVVTLIQDIAAQINLLALNATIESARAGEAGRGFAVVASEVKSLANQAARSTQTIANEIATMQAVTTEVVDALGLISGSMTHVLENVSAVASAMEQQSAVTSEITNNMQGAVVAVRDINDGLANISDTFGEVAAASEQVKREMDALNAA